MASALNQGGAAALRPSMNADAARAGLTPDRSKQEVPMPELLPDGLPAKGTRSKFDFAEWADGQAWKFVKGSDYDSSTETFRANVKRWAKLHGFEVELRPYPTVDREGHELPLVKADGVALGVRFIRNGNRGGSVAESRRPAPVSGVEPR
jgi:hypothetical protein